MNNIFKRRTVTAIVAVGLAGCSTYSLKPIEESVESKGRLIEQYRATIEEGRKVESAPVSRAVERVPGGVYLPVRRLESRMVKQDPVLLKQITINRTVFSVQELAERITLQSGVPVTVSPDVLVSPQGVSGAQPVAAAAPAAGPQGLPPLPPPGGSTGMMVGNTSPSATGFPMSISYDGTFRGLLEVTSSRMGVSWEYVDGQVRFFRYISKTFRLSALPGDTALDAKVSNTSSGGSGSSASGAAGGSTGGTSLSSTSTQNTGVSFNGLSVWKGIEDSVKTMLSPNGRVVVTPATGTLTVTDIPSVMENVTTFIDRQNQALSKQVVVNVRVLSVDLTNTASYGINWDAVYNSLSQKFGFTLSSAIAPAAGAGNLTLRVLNTATGGAQAWAGSKAVIDALEKQGRVANLTSANVTTLNNQPVPIQVGRQQGYIQSSSTTLGGTGGFSTTSITPGTITTGFSMTLLPHILDGNKLMLQYAMDLSSLLALNSVTSGTSTIQTPDLETRNFLQRVVANSGDTIVVAGFETTDERADKQGVIAADNPALGGATARRNNRSLIVILIQPLITD